MSQRRLGRHAGWHRAGAGDQPPATKPLSAERSILVSVTAKVQAIDLDKREVTLKGPLGNVTTFEVDERVKRLNEVSVGDDVTADYYVSLAGEAAGAHRGREDAPLTVLTDGARAPQGTSPAGGVLRAFKVVATVVGLISRRSR